MKAEVCTLVITALLFVGCSGVEFKYPTSADPCIIVKMEGNLSLSMIPSGGQPIKTDGDLNGATIAAGKCAQTGQNMAEIDLMLNNGVKGTLSLGFTKGADSKVTMDVTFTFMPDMIFKNGESALVDIKSVSSTPLSKDTASYTCTAEQEIKFNKIDGAKDQYEMKMSISNVQIQAFGVNKDFSPAEDCTALAVTTEQPAAPTTQPAAPTTQPPAPTTQPPAPTTQPPAQTTQPPAATSQPPAQTTQTPSNETTKMVPTTEKPENTSTEVPDVTTKRPSNESTTETPTTKTGTTMVPTMAPEPPTPKPGSPVTNTYTAHTTNSTCLMIKAGIEFVIPYESTKGNLTKTIGIPTKNENTTFSGDCEGTNNTQTVTIKFYENDWTLMMTFAESSKTQYYLSDVSLNAVVDDKLIPDIKAPMNINIAKAFKSDQFSASKSGSYKCTDNSKLTLQDGIEMDTYNFQYAAFQTNITAFSDDNVAECQADTKTNSVVPIAVGAALAGLVVIVLIAYLIGRKRSRQSGYEQV